MLRCQNHPQALPLVRLVWQRPPWLNWMWNRQGPAVVDYHNWYRRHHRRQYLVSASNTPMVNVVRLVLFAGKAFVKVDQELDVPRLGQVWMR